MRGKLYREPVVGTWVLARNEPFTHQAGANVQPFDLVERFGVEIFRARVFRSRHLKGFDKQEKTQETKT